MQDLLTCKNEDVSIEKKDSLEWSQVYGDFFRRPRAATSTVLGPIWPNFELILIEISILSHQLYNPLITYKTAHYNMIFHVIVFLVSIEFDGQQDQMLYGNLP